jgi:hypothetical protein
MNTIALADRALVSFFFGTGALPFLAEQKAAADGWLFNLVINEFVNTLLPSLVAILMHDTESPVTSILG